MHDNQAYLHELLVSLRKHPEMSLQVGELGIRGDRPENMVLDDTYQHFFGMTTTFTIYEKDDVSLNQILPQILSVFHLKPLHIVKVTNAKIH